MATNPLKRLKEIQQVDLKEKKTTYEELYSLRENPFPTMALFSPLMDDPRRNGIIYDRSFRSDEEKRFFEMFIESPSGGKTPSIGFIRLDPQAGGRGNGKSAFLNHLMKRINEKDWSPWAKNLENPELNVLAVHILPEPRGQKKFWQLVRLIFQNLYDSGIFKRLDVDFRAAILLKILKPQVLDELAGRPAETIEASLSSFSNLAIFLDEHSVKPVQFLTQAGKSMEESSKGMLNIRFHEELRSSNYSLNEMWEKWRSDHITDSDHVWRNNGIGWLINGLVPVLVTAGFQHLHILLDEFEKIYIYQNTRDREEFLDSVRQYFFERPSVAQRNEFITLILTIHPSIQRYLAEVWQRVGLENIAPLKSEAMTLQSVDLGPSTLPKLKSLLITYLDVYRTDKKHIGTLYPFENDALDVVIDESRYYPRAALWYAYTILMKAANADHQPPITKNYVESLAQSLQMPDDDDDNMFVLPNTTSTLKEQ